MKFCYKFTPNQKKIHWFLKAKKEKLWNKVKNTFWGHFLCPHYNNHVANYLTLFLIKFYILFQCVFFFIHFYSTSLKYLQIFLLFILFEYHLLSKTIWGWNYKAVQWLTSDYGNSSRVIMPLACAFEYYVKIWCLILTQLNDIMRFNICFYLHLCNKAE